MFFLIRMGDITELQALDKIPLDEELYIRENGHPLNLYIIDSKDNLLANSEEIGWMDEGEQTEELRDITLKDINTIFNLYEGRIEIDVDEEGTPIFQEEKVVLRYLRSNDEEENENIL